MDAALCMKQAGNWMQLGSAAVSNVLGLVALCPEKAGFYEGNRDTQQATAALTGPPATVPP